MTVSLRLAARKSILAAMVLAPVAPAFAQESDAARYPSRRADQPAAASSVRATFTVGEGQSIQAAVDRARPGDRIEVLPGTYKEEVTIDLDDIELVGIVVDGDRPVLDGEGKLNDAVLVSGHNFVVSGLEIRNYLGNGVVVSKAMNATFRNLVTSNTGKYAVYPVECDGVLVEHCVSSGVWDAAVYAGQCKNVVIRNNVAYGNTIGIETENCVDALIENNTTYDNALGILVVLLPNLPNKEMKNARVVGNRCFENNHPNFSPPGHIVNMVQPGVGIAINAADNVEVTRNEIRGNKSFGLTVYSLSDVLPGQQLDVEPHPDNLRVHGNAYADNGMNPDEIAERFKKDGLKGADIFWSGKGTGNGWAEATTRTEPAQLPPLAGVAGGL